MYFHDSDRPPNRLCWISDMQEVGDDDEAADRPGWLRATETDFSTTDVDEPLTAAKKIASCHEAARLFQKAAEAATEKGDQAGARAYSMLGAICSFYFKPGDQNEPFGPMMRLEDGRRSSQPTDFRGSPESVLAAQLDRISHLGVRTRVADIVWLLDRKRVGAGLMAVNGYGDIVEELAKHPVSSGEYEIPDLLRRGLQIGKSIGWEKPPVVRVRELVARFRQAASEGDAIGGFLQLADLDLDYQIADPAGIATEAEAFAGKADFETKNNALQCAARAHRRTGSQTEANRCLLAAGEALVSGADSQTISPMLEAHWLEKAIAQIRRLPKTKDRVRELKHRLVEVQSRIPDEMSLFTHTEDISDVVDNVRAKFRGQSRATALRLFALLARSPSPTALQEEARRLISEFPLSSIFSSTKYDSRGLVSHRSGGADTLGGDESVRDKIAELEVYRRNSIAVGLIQPARRTIMEDHAIGDDDLAILCVNSPFVPADRAAIFTTGLLRFLQGDMTAALHILVPQLENALRNILKDLGCDVVRLNDDMTQEELGLSALFDRFSAELEQCFGTALVADMRNVFILRAGPQLRDRIAHGLISDWESFSPDAVYACWLIYQLVCMPLLRQWENVANSMS
jgi:hypothetical protein